MGEVREQSSLDEFLKQISSINNLFDLMALCINYVLIEIDEQELDTVDVLNSGNRGLGIIDVLYTYKQGRKIDIAYRCLERLKIQLREQFRNNLLINENVISQCIQIIIWIDNNWEPEYESDGIFAYESLNNQFNDKIRIIPRMNNRVDGFSGMFTDEKGLEAFRKDYPVRKVFYDNIVCRYIILDENFLKGYDVQIHHLGHENAFVRKIRDKQTLSFAIFPVLNVDLSEYFQLNKFEAEKRDYFEIDGMLPDKEKMLKQRYNEIFKSCDSEDIDFLVFPEMLMTEGIFEELQRNKKENWIVFWGSIWKNMTNRCVVTSGRQTILSYDKKIGFELKENKRVYLEHLKERMKKVPYAVLDIEEIGRVGVCICRDLTFQEVSNLHACLETNILIVPAFSESMDVYAGAEELAKKEKCIVVLANSCSACYNKKHKGTVPTDLGFLVVPAKKGNTRSVYKEVYGNAQCLSGCASVCKGVLFIVDFSTKIEKDDLLTMRITKKAVIS